jgi:hypothetical protein
MHVDSIAIPGASYETLRRAFVAEWSNSTTPVDVILISGYNEVLSGSPFNQILRDLHRLRREVLRIPDSSFSCASLPYPPCMTAFGGEALPPNRQDRLDMMSELNDEFHAINRDLVSRWRTDFAPSFQTYGLKTVRVNSQQPRTLRATFRGHRGADWRELIPANQLHPSDRNRRRMGIAVLRYYLALYGLRHDREGPVDE